MVISESALSDSRDLWRDLRVVPGHFRAKASVTAHDFPKNSNIRQPAGQENVDVFRRQSPTLVTNTWAKHDDDLKVAAAAASG
jgi:hypothetical protein